MSHTADLIWVPLSRIGAIEFGEPLGEAVDIYRLVRLPDEERNAVGWDVFGNPGDTLRVYVAGGVVTSVACYERCVINGHNILGMSMDEVFPLVGCKRTSPDDVIDVMGEQQEVYELESHEGQLWVNDGRVVAVFCGPEL